MYILLLTVSLLIFELHEYIGNRISNSPSYLKLCRIMGDKRDERKLTEVHRWTLKK